MNTRNFFMMVILLTSCSAAMANNKAKIADNSFAQALENPISDPVVNNYLAKLTAHSAAEKCPRYENLQTQDEMWQSIDETDEISMQKNTQNNDNQIFMRKMAGFHLGLGYSRSEVMRWGESGLSVNESCGILERIMKKCPFIQKHIRAVKP